jgi:hypothetical protein
MLMHLPENLDALTLEQLRDIIHDHILILGESSSKTLGNNVGSIFTWGMDMPTQNHPDLPSIVAIKAPLANYTRPELVKLLWYTKIVTEEYDAIFPYHRGANMHVIEKQTSGSQNQWYYNQFTWTLPACRYDSLNAFLTERMAMDRLPQLAPVIALEA